MKYIVVLGDGMADYPIKELNDKTPLEYARTPRMDYLASHGICGLVKTVPDHMPPGSDTANLSVMSYDPEVYYSGRSPLEAVSMGIQLAADDVTYRCNTVTLSDEDRLEDCTMIDYSCDEITTEESTVLINYLNEAFHTSELTLYPGISYRHCLVLNHAQDGGEATPPHDILSRKIGTYLPKGQNAELLLELTRRSRELLKDHPVNQDRIRRGLNPANAVWFWGEGRKPALSSFEEKYGIKGAVVSAVDLIKGIGLCAGLNIIDVPGATGNYDTDYEGKAQAALDALLKDGNDFVYVHVEAPDECGHHADLPHKVQSIEDLDRRLIAPIMDTLAKEQEDYRILVLPDHPTPISLRTHVSDPVPFTLYQHSQEKMSTASSYCEQSAKNTGIFVEKGHSLLDMLIK